MQKVLFETLIVPTCPPKDSSIPMGYSYQLDGKLNEHFEDTQSTVTDLIENTIRYEAKNAG